MCIRDSFLFRGTGNGDFSLQNNRLLMGTIQAVGVMDIDADGMDDLVAVETDLQGGIWYLRGDSTSLLEMARWVPVPMRVVYQVRASGRLVLFGQGGEGNNWLCEIQWKDGGVQIERVRVPSGPPFFGTLTLGDEGEETFFMLFEHMGWAFSDGREGEDMPVPIDGILDFGDRDGRRMAYAIVFSLDDILLWLVEENSVLHLGPFTEDDQWCTADLDGDGTDEAIRLGPEGEITIHFLSPSPGALVLSPPTSGSKEYVLTPLDLEGDGREEILLFSWVGHSLIFRLTGVP